LANSFGAPPSRRRRRVHEPDATRIVDTYQQERRPERPRRPLVVVVVRTAQQGI